MVKMLFLHVVLCCAIVNCVVFPVSANDENEKFQPVGCTREEWDEHFGLCPEQARERDQCWRNAGEMLEIDDQQQPIRNQINQKLGFLEDILLDNVQCTDLLQSLNNKRKKKRRKKRKIRKDFRINRWPQPIMYKIDGSIAGHKTEIETALNMWTERTCLEFKEINLKTDYKDNHILFATRAMAGCFSYIGRASSINPQPIYLSYACYTPAIIAHELGHALGFVHEHQRSDRNDYVTIVDENVKESSKSLFHPFNSSIVDNLDVPYDYGSDMHYKSDAFSQNGQNTILTKDPRFQRTIGQRVELSFADIMIANRAYCSDTCAQHPSLMCKHKGYQSPADCTRCVCPDGLGGRYCGTAAPFKGAACGGERFATPQTKYEWSPNYHNAQPNNHYEIGQECSWLIKAPTGSVIVLKFLDDFGVYCYGSRCLHWVELRYGTEMGDLGPRYCCNDLPEETIVSETNQMLVIFKAKDDWATIDEMRGFTYSYCADGDECEINPCQHGGRCTDNTCGFTCDCPYGYSGDTCEIVENVVAVESNTPLDLVIMLDVANHPDKDLESMKNLALSVIDSVDFGPDSTRVGFLTFDQSAYSKAVLDTYTSVFDLIDMVDDVRIGYREANYFRALWQMLNHVLTYAGGARSGAQDVVLLIADSAPSNSVSRAMYNVVLGQMKSRDIKLVIVAIGDKVDIGLLRSFVDNDDEVLRVRSYSNLGNTQLLRDVMYQIAPAVSQDTYKRTTPYITTNSQKPSTSEKLTSTRLITYPTSRPTRPSRPTQGSTSTFIPTKQTSQSSSARPVNGGNLPQRPTVATTTARGCWMNRKTCNKDCGGCGERDVEFECGFSDGSTEIKQRWQEPCGSLSPCEKICNYWIGQLYQRPCNFCCDGYHVEGDRCVKDASHEVRG